MEQKQFVKQLIQYLQEVEKHPRMFFSEDMPPVLSFIQGFRLACFAMDLQWQYFETYLEVQTALKYPVSALHFVGHLINEEMPEREIITKALELEILTWERILKQLDSDPPEDRDNPE